MTKRYELSAEQKEFIKFEYMYPGTCINTICGVCWLETLCPDEDIKKAVNLIILYEQAMCLRIEEHDGEFLQYEQEFDYVRISTLDCTMLSNEELEQLLLREAQTVIPFINNTLYTFKILRHSEKVALLVLVHHIIADGYSMSLLGSRIIDYCEKFKNRESINLREHKFTDFLEREKGKYSPARHERDRGYWADMYRDWGGICKINPRAAASEDISGGRIYIPLEAGLSRAMLSCERGGRFTPAVVFRGALLLYIYRQNPGKKRIDIGENLLNRATIEDRETLGLYCAERMLCVEVSNDDTVGEFFSKIVTASAKAYYHGLCLCNEVCEIAKTFNPTTDSIRDVEFSYLSAQLGASAEKLEWICNGAPEVSVEFTLTNLGESDGFGVPILQKINA